MENFLDGMAPLYALYLGSGLIIYAISSWLGEALLNQIKNNKTSLFGRDTVQARNSYTMYMKPEQLSTISRTKNVSNVIPNTLPAVRPQVSRLPNLPSR
jgi:hypothetical protein